MAITCSVLAAPTNCTATLVAGGSLAANTTYYYVVVAYSTNYYTPNNSSNLGDHSPVSAEGSFTTDNTNRSVRINWSNVAGATRYQIFISTTSNSYYASRANGTITTDAVGAISNGVAGYLITSIVASPDNPYIIHSCQMRNSLYKDIDKNLGIIKVYIDGTSSITLADIYAAIVAQGYSNYVYYDGYLFVLKGYIICDSTVTDAGSLVIENKCLVFLHGGIINRSATYIIRIGRLFTGTNIANPLYSANIDICNSRTPFFGSYENSLKVYGVNLTIAKSTIRTLPEIISNIYYLLGGNISIRSNVANFKEVNTAIGYRSTDSNIFDIKMYQVNNFENQYYYTRVTLYDNGLGYYVYLPYSSTPKGFYNCKWINNSWLQFYAINSTYDNHKAFFYDNTFETSTGEPDLRYSYMTSTHYTTNQTAYFYNSLAFTVIDTSGNAIQDASILIRDKDNNIVNLYEHDKTENRWTTGNTYTSMTTDASGTNDFYIETYNIKLNPANIDYPISTNIIKTYYYPFSVNISKENYENYSFIIDDFTERKEYSIILLNEVLEKPEITNLTIRESYLKIDASSGTPPYQYKIEGLSNFDYQSSNIFENINGGIYNIYVKDSNDLVDSLTGLRIESDLTNEAMEITLKELNQRFEDFVTNHKVLKTYIPYMFNTPANDPTRLYPCMVADYSKSTSNPNNGIVNISLPIKFIDKISTTFSNELEVLTLTHQLFEDFITYFGNNKSQFSFNVSYSSSAKPFFSDFDGLVGGYELTANIIIGFSRDEQNIPIN